MRTSSLISESAKLGNGVVIGRFCVIEDNVSIGDGAVIEDFSLLMDGCKVGARTRIGTHCKVGKGAEIGSDCSFTAYCEIREQCLIGNRVSMGSRGTLSARTIVEDDVIMKYAFVVTDTPVLAENDCRKSSVLRRGSRFGASVVIMPDLTIGENAEIGACSQVRKNVPDNEVWFGIPAKYYRDCR